MSGNVVVEGSSKATRLPRRTKSVLMNRRRNRYADKEVLRAKSSSERAKSVSFVFPFFRPDIVCLYEKLLFGLLSATTGWTSCAPCSAFDMLCYVHGTVRVKGNVEDRVRPAFDLFLLPGATGPVSPQWHSHEVPRNLYTSFVVFLVICPPCNNVDTVPIPPSRFPSHETLAMGPKRRS